LFALLVSVCSQPK